MSIESENSSDQILGKRSSKAENNLSLVDMTAEENSSGLKDTRGSFSKKFGKEVISNRNYLKRETKTLDFESIDFSQRKSHKLALLPRGPDFFDHLATGETILFEGRKEKRPSEPTKTQNQSGEFSGETGAPFAILTKPNLNRLGEVSRRVEDQLSYLSKAYQFLRFYFTKADTSCLAKLSIELDIPKKTLELWLREKSYIISKAKLIRSPSYSNDPDERVEDRSYKKS